MLPVIEGLIARRMLLNVRADANLVQRFLPAPLKVDQHRGHSIAGVCLIRSATTAAKAKSGYIFADARNA